MKLKLQRFICTPDFTMGNLFVDDDLECLILEDPDRRLEDNPDAKVYGKTCIPRGTYEVILSWSNRFKRILPLIVGVHGYTGVRIHPGNDVEDTDGCLLTGTAVGQTGTVINSRRAFDKLFAKLEQAEEYGESITIEIV